MDKHGIPLDRASPTLSSHSLSSAGSGSQGDHIHYGDDLDDPFVLSGANTPIYEDRPEETVLSHLGSADQARAKIPRSAATGSVAMEVPVLPRNLRTAAAPPAPLSARGDVIGGYFPMHEDPAKRVQQPHPFHLDESRAKAPTSKGKGRHPKSASGGHPSLILNDAEPIKAPPAPPSDTRLTSYLPSGIHTGSLPMGKYYPSNYEKQQQLQQQKKPPLHPSKSSKTTSQVPTCRTGPAASSSSAQNPWPEGDAKQKLQQYQRDMIAQATLAARKVMGSSGSRAGQAIPGFAPHGGLPISAPATANPASPRLRPLGSPGPVTPMELGGSETSYLDKGVGGSPSAAERSARSRERRQPMSPGRSRMRAETRSPALTPAC
ncbi:uncharacterized protein DNG_06422 [Cephalotrichum gorgonifer]|uniref:Uncharacterized protein n=1 Tax=Cephalotrichum gorgonifer TaxID=2041049 RepID=A0AAE8N1J8_9PEZI|nr:uncharacterized protein DNG_06422 [Cephalotrichum gorgonifer]